MRPCFLVLAWLGVMAGSTPSCTRRLVSEQRPTFRSAEAAALWGVVTSTQAQLPESALVVLGEGTSPSLPGDSVGEFGFLAHKVIVRSWQDHRFGHENDQLISSVSSYYVSVGQGGRDSLRVEVTLQCGGRCGAKWEVWVRRTAAGHVFLSKQVMYRK